MPRKSILVVDDEKPQRDILQEILTSAGYDVTSAASGEAALKFAKDRSFDLALTDLKMTGMDGIELLQHLLALDSSIIVILLTAHGTIDSAKEALRRGAFDYLQKPFDRERLLQTIKRALGTLDKIDVEIISASPKMEAVKKMILKVARSNSTVLVRGESGTGKELIARAIHNQSPRSSEMFQAVNCAAINENLLESELFGHEKGSFTGAHAEKKGLFEVADRGTLFLDEIAELDVGMQAKLLRALQERRIRRVGGTHELPIDVRVVAATNRDLISPEDLPTEVRQESQTAVTGGFKLPAEGINFEEVEKNLILQAMDSTDYNITKAATLLGLTFRTLQYRLEKFGIKRSDGKDGKSEDE